MPQTENPVPESILGDYSTIYFDLDGVVWDCITADGKGMGAYQTVPPYQRLDLATVKDIKGNIVRLQHGIRTLLELLDHAGKNLGIVSRSEVKDVPFEAQPAIILLRRFDLYKYFNYNISLHIDEPKEEYVKTHGKTLFIDDDQANTQAVNQSLKADVLWRKAFGEWSTLLAPKQASLNFELFKLAQRRRVSVWQENRNLSKLQ